MSARRSVQTTIIHNRSVVRTPPAVFNVVLTLRVRTLPAGKAGIDFKTGQTSAYGRYTPVMSARRSVQTTFNSRSVFNVVLTLRAVMSRTFVRLRIRGTEPRGKAARKLLRGERPRIPPRCLRRRRRKHQSRRDSALNGLRLFCGRDVWRHCAARLHIAVPARAGSARCCRGRRRYAPPCRA